VADAEASAGECVDEAAVTGAVIAEDSLDDDPVAAVEGDCSLEEAGGGACPLVCEDFGVGEAAVVVDRDVDVLPAELALEPPLVAAALAGAVSADPVPDPRDPAELFDVDVEELAGRERSYRTGFSSPSRPSRPSPIRVRIPETVESAIPSVSAISAAVKRS
jgi:hypothetical protein